MHSLSRTDKLAVACHGTRHLVHLTLLQLDQRIYAALVASNCGEDSSQGAEWFLVSDLSSVSYIISQNSGL
jgi:hypothetical protein